MTRPHYFDWYARYAIQSLEDIDNLTRGSQAFQVVEDTASRLDLLAGALHEKRSADRDGKWAFTRSNGKTGRATIMEYARGTGEEAGPPAGLRPTIEAVNEVAMGQAQEMLKDLGIPADPVLPDALVHLSWCLNVPFRLRKPLISRDDRQFYIIENPVRRERVFRAPMVSDTSWKGNLRWTMMKVRLQDHHDTLSASEFAEERFRQALLFGTEQGTREEEPSGFARHLDRLRPDAIQEYRAKLAAHFEAAPDTIVHHRGRLHFYPTFFDRMSLDIINPHSRRTGSGSVPVQMECVPGGEDPEKSARGAFRLLYFPFDLIGRTDVDVKAEARADLTRVAEGVKAMMLDYGFSAKKSSGFGVIHDKLDGEGGVVEVAGKPVQFERLSGLTEVAKL